MLQHLVRLAERLEAEGDLIPLGYKQFSTSSSVDWVVEVDDDGTVRAREASIDKPRPSRQRSGKPSPTNLKPYFLADQARYAIGLPEEGKQDEAELLYRGFRELTFRAAEETGDEDLERLAKRLEAGPVHEALEVEIDPRDYVTFQTRPDQLTFEREAARRFWADYVEDEFTSEQVGTCSVCGTEAQLLQTLPQKVTLMGETCQISSFNLSAFTSYGKEQTVNASLCYACGARAAQAFNYLTKTDEHNRQLVRNPRQGASPSLKDQLAVFWSEVDQVETETGQPVDVSAALQIGFDADLPEDEEGSVEEVKQLLDVPWSTQAAGLRADEGGIHLVVLSPNKARLVIREWLHENLESFRGNLRAFLEVTTVESPYGEQGRPFGISELLNALSVKGLDPDGGGVRSRREVEANEVRGLLRTAYAGDPPPGDLTPSVVRVLRNPSAWSAPWLTQRLVSVLHLAKFHERSRGDSDTMTETKMARLDEERADPGFLCGRLMAVLESIQQRAADGELNTTIVDRNYNAAATAPGSTLPRLLNQAESAHLPKIRKNRGKNTAEGIRNDIEAILARLDSFPKTLDTDGQGDFALGFYHQRAANRRARREHYESNKEDDT